MKNEEFATIKIAPSYLCHNPQIRIMRPHILVLDMPFTIYLKGKPYVVKEKWIWLFKPLKSFQDYLRRRNERIR